MVELKTQAEVEATATAGAVVGEALRAVAERARPDWSTSDLDKVAAGARILTN
jgi:methionine aminopeptidase